MTSRALLRLILGAAVLWPGAGPARASAVPNAISCVAQSLADVRAVPVREHVGESGFAAYATYDPDGWPAITYAQAYFALPPVLQRFLSLHECGHLVLRTTNEIVANCYAVEQGHWSASELALIALSHRTMTRLPPQYGGSGPAFWAATKRKCPQFMVGDP